MAIFTSNLTRRRRLLLMPGSDAAGQPVWIEADDLDALEGDDEPLDEAPVSPLAVTRPSVVPVPSLSAVETPPLLPAPTSPPVPAFETLELVLTSPDGHGIERVKIDEATCVVGSGSQSDLRLPHPDVSRCHVLLHRLGGRLLVADLLSRTGIVHNGQRRTTCWLSPGDVLQIGPFSLRWPTAPGTESVESPASDDLEPPTGVRGFALRLPNDAGAQIIDVSPRLPVFLVGRDPACGLRLRDKNVARVHVALLNLPDRLLAIDLVRRGEVAVNGETGPRLTLRTGDELRIGTHRLQVIEPPQTSAATSPHAENVSSLAESPDIVIRTLVAALANLQRQHHDLAQRQAEVLTGLVDEIPEARRGDVLAEIEQLRAVVREFDAVARQARNRPVNSTALTDAGRALILSQSRARRTHAADADDAASEAVEPNGPRSAVERPPVAAHYGRIAQRIANHARATSGPPSRWQRLRSVFLPG